MFSRIFAIILFVLGGALAPAARADAFSQKFVPGGSQQPVSVVNFEDGHGRSLSLKDFSGRYVLLHLWASWCAPCVKEMPALEALRNKFNNRQFEIVALSEDHEGAAAAQAFYQRRGIQYMPVFVDRSGRAPALLHAEGLPTTIFINPSGTEYGRIAGEADWASPEALQFIQSWLKTRMR